MTEWHHWRHEILPASAQQILREAASVGTTESLARRRAVEEASLRVRRSFPQLFKPEAGVSKYAAATK
ncbi:hypothetical protein [Castellaniella sp.]|uniref:hypothetical protein n=1 Tax=Castellaniella sp. TaxID=1955812 RepID=UPI0025B8AF9C|nr:hypothetical protein [Castellaniella sp.]